MEILKADDKAGRHLQHRQNLLVISPEVSHQLQMYEHLSVLEEFKWDIYAQIFSKMWPWFMRSLSNEIIFKVWCKVVFFFKVAIIKGYFLRSSDHLKFVMINATYLPKPADSVNKTEFKVSTLPLKGTALQKGKERRRVIWQFSSFCWRE